MSDTYVRSDADYSPYVQWSPVIAGALAAAALASVFHAFALVVGLAVSSTSPPGAMHRAGFLSFLLSMSS
jgi:hypothetical protein